MLMYCSASSEIACHTHAKLDFFFNGDSPTQRYIQMLLSIQNVNLNGRICLFLYRFTVSVELILKLIIPF